MNNNDVTHNTLLQLLTIQEEVLCMNLSQTSKTDVLNVLDSCIQREMNVLISKKD